MKKLISVVGAAIIQNQKILCVQRSNSMSLPGFWEFPGGKIELQESKEQALIREIEEELKLKIKILSSITTARHEYDFGIVELTVFTASIEDGELTLLEHQDYKWLPPNQLLELTWAPVDIPAATLLSKIVL